MPSNGNGNGDQTPLIECTGISKAFGHVQALDNVDFALYPGEVVGLVGDNGAGKSTLVKILSGVYHADAGEVYVNGQPVNIRDPLDAQEFGIATVYQDLQLVDSRDVASNIYLGREPMRWIIIDRRKMWQDAEAVLGTLRMKMPSVRVMVGDLSGGQKQAVAIARALSRGRRIFLFDEPTAALAVAESEKVMSLIRDLAQKGSGIVVIAHNMAHVFRVADRICVLRHGKIVQDTLKKDTTPEEVVSHIVGATEVAREIFEASHEA
jgi:ABC-type sugar transport system ATPase subunit